MTTVVDSSVLVAALVDLGEDGAWSETAISRDLLAVPEMALAEATNILRRLELAGQLPRRDAAAAQADLMRIDVEVYPFAPFAGRVWELRQNLTSYDAWYVALAEALDCSLATLDLRLSRSRGPTCPVLTPGAP